MKYEVRCECGKPFAVTGADAGTSLRCACGRSVEVPPLHKLRTSDGEPSLTLLVRIRSEVRTGRLPGTTHCACCPESNVGFIRIVAACEQEAGTGHPSGAESFGCLLDPVFGLVGTIFLKALQEARERELDVSVVLPLPVCEACRPSLKTPNELREALLTIPDYATLLNQYPNAQITRLG